MCEQKALRYTQGVRDTLEWTQEAQQNSSQQSRQELIMETPAQANVDLILSYLLRFYSGNKNQVATETWETIRKT